MREEETEDALWRKKVCAYTHVCTGTTHLHVHTHQAKPARGQRLGGAEVAARL